MTPYGLSVGYRRSEVFRGSRFPPTRLHTECRAKANSIWMFHTAVFSFWRQFVWKVCYVGTYTCAHVLGTDKVQVLMCVEGFTYLLTPWCRVLLEKLTGFQLVKKLPAFYGTRRFITAFTSARHLSLSWASSIQPTPPTSWISISILFSHLRLGLPSGLFPSCFPTKTLYTPLLSPVHSTFSAHLILHDFISRTILGEEYRSFSFSLYGRFYMSETVTLYSLRERISPAAAPELESCSVLTM